jgi:hypothetical protein
MEQREAQAHGSGHDAPQGRSASALDDVNVMELLGSVSEVARENPHSAIAAALGVGFLLGGGLTPRLLASIALIAGRRLLAQAATEALESAVRQQIDAATAGGDATTR